MSMNSFKGGFPSGAEPPRSARPKQTNQENGFFFQSTKLSDDVFALQTLKNHNFIPSNLPKYRQAAPSPSVFTAYKFKTDALHLKTDYNLFF